MYDPAAGGRAQAPSSDRQRVDLRQRRAGAEPREDGARGAQRLLRLAHAPQRQQAAARARAARAPPRTASRTRASGRRRRRARVAAASVSPLALGEQHRGARRGRCAASAACSPPRREARGEVVRAGAQGGADRLRQVGHVVGPAARARAALPALEQAAAPASWPRAVPRPGRMRAAHRPRSTGISLSRPRCSSQSRNGAAALGLTAERAQQRLLGADDDEVGAGLAALELRRRARPPWRAPCPTRRTSRAPRRG